MDIKIIDNGLSPDMLQPQTQGAAAIDLRAILDNPITLHVNQSIVIPAGIQLAIPDGWVGLISPRSGLGVKGLVIGNLTGVIDSDYRGEVKICLWNRKAEGTFTVNPYDRIAQLYVMPHYDYSQLNFTDSLSDTERGTSGFGSTGTA